jgi:hypothetical protein
VAAAGGGPSALLRVSVASLDCGGLPWWTLLLVDGAEATGGDVVQWWPVQRLAIARRRRDLNVGQEVQRVPRGQISIIVIVIVIVVVVVVVVSVVWRGS